MAPRAVAGGLTDILTINLLALQEILFRIIARQRTRTASVPEPRQHAITDILDVTALVSR